MAVYSGLPAAYIPAVIRARRHGPPKQVPTDMDSYLRNLAAYDYAACMLMLRGDH